MLRQASLLQQAHDEGSQSHAVGGELWTRPDFTHQPVQDFCGRTWSWTKKKALECRLINEYKKKISGDIYQFW